MQRVTRLRAAALAPSLAARAGARGIAARPLFFAPVASSAAYSARHAPANAALSGKKFRLQGLYGAGGEDFPPASAGAARAAGRGLATAPASNSASPLAVRGVALHDDYATLSLSDGRRASFHHIFLRYVGSMASCDGGVWRAVMAACGSRQRLGRGGRVWGSSGCEQRSAEPRRGRSERAAASGERSHHFRHLPLFISPL